MHTPTEVRILIQSGRVDEAIELLHTHFPTVLPQESILASDVAPCTSVSPLSNDSFVYDSDTSVDPTHLLLNLRILGFIEAARTVPLPYHPPGVPVPEPSPRAASPVAKETRGEHDDPELGADPMRNNDFDYATMDPHGYKCPVGSHARRLNPRDTEPNPNRRRMIRRSGTYGPALPEGASRLSPIQCFPPPPSAWMTPPPTIVFILATGTLSSQRDKSSRLALYHAPCPIIAIGV